MTKSFFVVRCGGVLSLTVNQARTYNTYIQAHRYVIVLVVKLESKYKYKFEDYYH